jgi:HEAT repeat protein
LAEQLQSSDKDTFDIGLRAARELDASEVTTTLMTELERATPERRALLILTLVDLNDVAALPAMIKAAGGGEVQTRIAAIQMLGRLGDGSCVPVLLDAALESDQRLSRAALEMLVALPDKKVDADLAARLAKAEGAARRVLIELAGRRQITAAVPILLKAADDTDIEIRAAALTALGYTVELRDLTVLIARVANPPKTIEEARAAEAALRAACQRMPDREACAERLVIAMSQSSVAAKCRFLEILTVMGGERALQAVGVAARDTDPELQDTGSRLLGEWIGPDAAPVLLDLTKTAKQEKYKIRALRGYIRLARQFEMPPRQRAEMCRTALDFARRDEERKLVLEVLERYPNSDTLGIAVQASKLPNLKSDAMRTALVIAEQIGEPADLVQVLAEHGQKPMKIEIIKAEYGAGARRKDVTEILQKYVRGYPLITLPSPKYNDSFDGDPAGGVVKQLTVRYRIDGKAAEASFQENDKIVLPVPE